jgi:hypothetical protein
VSSRLESFGDRVCVTPWSPKGRINRRIFLPFTGARCYDLFIYLFIYLFILQYFILYIYFLVCWLFFICFILGEHIFSYLRLDNDIPANRIWIRFVEKSEWLSLFACSRILSVPSLFFLFLFSIFLFFFFFYLLFLFFFLFFLFFFFSIFFLFLYELPYSTVVGDGAIVAD